MREEDFERIDVSEWMHASFHKAYPDQMRRVSEFRGRYSVHTPENIFDVLYARNIFNASDLSSAEFFFTLNEVATSKTGYAKMMSMLRDMKGINGGDKIPGFCPNTLLMLIARNMGPAWKYAMVERVCLRPVRPNDYGWIDKCQGSIKAAFNELGRSIEISIDTLKKRLENGNNYEGRSMPKIPQPV